MRWAILARAIAPGNTSMACNLIVPTTSLDCNEFAGPSFTVASLHSNLLVCDTKSLDLYLVRNIGDEIAEVVDIYNLS